MVAASVVVEMTMRLVVTIMTTKMMTMKKIRIVSLEGVVKLFVEDEGMLEAAQLLVEVVLVAVIEEEEKEELVVGVEMTEVKL